MTVYAKIQNGVVVNTQLIGSGDALDPAFTWVDLTGKSCTNGVWISVGTQYDGTNFIDTHNSLQPTNS